MFVYVGNWFDNVLNGYAAAVAGGLISNLWPLFAVATTLWVLISGYQILMGQAHGDLMHWSWQAGRVVLINSVIGAGASYVTTIVPLVNSTTQDLANVMLPPGVPAMSASPWTMIDGIVGAVSSIAAAAQNEAGIGGWMFHLDLLLATVLLFIASFFVMLVAGYVVLVAKAAMALYLALGPIFIALAMFNPTAQFFWSWVKCVATAMLTMVVAFFIVGLILFVGQQVLSSTLNASGAFNSTLNIFGQVAGLAAVLVLLAIVAHQAPHLAAGLTGGGAFEMGGGLARDISRLMRGRPSNANQRGGGTVQGQSARSRIAQAAAASRDAAGRGARAAARTAQAAYQRAATAARGRWS